MLQLYIMKANSTTFLKINMIGTEYTKICIKTKNRVCIVVRSLRIYVYLTIFALKINVRQSTKMSTTNAWYFVSLLSHFYMHIV